MRFFLFVPRSRPSARVIKCVTPGQNALPISANVGFRLIRISSYLLKSNVIPYREVWKQKVREHEKVGEKLVSFKDYKFQALAPRGLVFAPATKYARISGALALDKSNFFTQFSLLRWFGCAILSQQNVGKPTKAAVNVPAKNIFCLKIYPQLPNSK